jgi:hypothetical protein
MDPNDPKSKGGFSTVRVLDTSEKKILLEVIEPHGTYDEAKSAVTLAAAKNDVVFAFPVCMTPNVEPGDLL